MMNSGADIYGTGASGIAYAVVASAIFAARYLDVLRYAFKLTWVALGITIAAEIAGKALLNQSFATQLLVGLVDQGSEENSRGGNQGKAPGGDDLDEIVGQESTESNLLMVSLIQGSRPSSTSLSLPCR